MSWKGSKDYQDKIIEHALGLDKNVAIDRLIGDQGFAVLYKACGESYANWSKMDQDEKNVAFIDFMEARKLYGGVSQDTPFS